MPEYHASPELLRTLRRRVLFSALPLALIAVAVGAAGVVTRPGPILFVVPLIALVLAISLLNAYRRQSARIATLTFVTTRDGLTQSIDGAPPFTIDREAVRRIEVHASGEITLHGPTDEESIRIPREIEHREMLLEELKQWAPLEDGPAVRSNVQSRFTSLAVIAGFAAVVLSQDPRIVVPAGVAVVVALAWSSVAILRNKYVDEKTRRMALFMILPVAAVVLKIIAVLRA
ncbi:MAG TPA: hypothetical protein VF111_06395 [Thermoanaerobaculia bacterium]